MTRNPSVIYKSEQSLASWLFGRTPLFHNTHTHTHTHTPVWVSVCVYVSMYLSSVCLRACVRVYTLPCFITLTHTWVERAMSDRLKWKETHKWLKRDLLVIYRSEKWPITPLFHNTHTHVSKKSHVSNRLKWKETHKWLTVDLLVLYKIEKWPMTPLFHNTHTHVIGKRPITEIYKFVRSDW